MNYSIPSLLFALKPYILLKSKGYIIPTFMTRDNVYYKYKFDVILLKVDDIACKERCIIFRHLICFIVIRYAYYVF